MAKIVFVGEEEQAQEAEASLGDTAELFRLAERLSEAELEKIKRAITGWNDIAPDAPQNGPELPF